MKGLMTGMILYNKSNNSSFSKHVVTAHNRIFPHFVSYMDGQPKIVAGDDAYSLEVIVDTPLSRHKMPNDESSCTSEMAIVFVRGKTYGPNHPHQMENEDHLVMMVAHTYKPMLLV